MVAAPWIPDESLVGGGGVISAVMSGRLDASYFGLVAAPMALLGRLSASDRTVARVGGATGCHRLADRGRRTKHYAGSALLDASGDEVAAAAAIWIEIDQLPT